MDVIKNTLKLLSLASEYGYKRIAIGIRHKDIPKSVSFPFEPDRIVFGWPCDKTTTSGGTWPAIWKIIEKLGAGAGCGNSHQMQIKSEMFLEKSQLLQNGAWLDSQNYSIQFYLFHLVL